MFARDVALFQPVDLGFEPGTEALFALGSARRQLSEREEPFCVTPLA